MVDEFQDINKVQFEVLKLMANPNNNIFVVGDEDQTLDILNRSEYGILSTIGVDNVPYGVPMNFVYEDGVIYFHCAKAVGYKVSNIIHNSNACFTVINDVCLQPKTFSTKYSSAIVFGKVSIVEDEDEKKKGLEALIKKLSPEYIESGMKYIDKSASQTYVLKMEITEMTGKGKK